MMLPPAPVSFNVPRKLQGLYRPMRYKILHGGRGGAKSWGVADALIAQAHSRKLRILCAREFQSSMADSVHKLLTDRIEALGLRPYFKITDTAILAACGSEFLFKGLRRNIREIKSTEGVDICWVEEARSVSDHSWEVLIPTIRKEGSEIWATYNPEDETDPVDKRFRQTVRADTWCAAIGWQDNPYFPATLDAERRYAETNDPDAYQHVWEGGYRKISAAQIFRGRFRVESFTAPEGARFFYGMDFGFATDPSAVVRCYVHEDTLYIDHEAFGYGVELDELPQLMRGVPGIDRWPVKADCSRPETISHLRGKQFAIDAAKKWQGSVEDGIAHIRGFRNGIVIHERCKNMAAEARLYSYKVDATSGDVLPVIVDKHNHGWDAVRYALDGYIKQSGAMGAWERLGAA